MANMGMVRPLVGVRGRALAVQPAVLFTLVSLAALIGLPLLWLPARLYLAGLDAVRRPLSGQRLRHHGRLPLADRGWQLPVP